MNTHSNEIDYPNSPRFPKINSESEIFLSNDDFSSFDQYCLTCLSLTDSSSVLSMNSLCCNMLKTIPEILSARQILKCEECEKIFACPSNLNTHSRKHKSTLMFACEICQKVFSQKGNLNIHYKVHSGEKPFTCSLCFAKFSTKGHLTDHYRRHTGERPFACGCGESFMRSSTLKKHLLVHSGEKKHVCQYCEKRFSDSGNLKTHIRIHTGERPYLCEFINCQKRFRTKRHLQDHISSKHN